MNNARVDALCIKLFLVLGLFPQSSHKSDIMVSNILELLVHFAKLLSRRIVSIYTSTSVCEYPTGILLKCKSDYLMPSLKVISAAFTIKTKLCKTQLSAVWLLSHYFSLVGPYIQGS